MSRFDIKQFWMGYVQSINQKDHEFVALLKDQTNKDNLDEEVTLSIDEISDGDLSLLNPGAVFYWSIGYYIDSNGTKTKQSKIRLRRLKGPSKGQLDTAKKEAAKLEILFEEYGQKRV